jgi:hypothetical protein
MRSAARTFASAAPRCLLPCGLCSAAPPEKLADPPRPGPVDPDPHLVGALCRVLSDSRGPQHDLRAPLRGFEARLTPAAAAGVLRRCRNLPAPRSGSSSSPPHCRGSRTFPSLSSSSPARWRARGSSRCCAPCCPTSPPPRSRGTCSRCCSARTPVRASHSTPSGPSPPWSGSDSRQRSLICTPSSSHYPIMAW